MTEKIKKFIEEFKKLENRETIKINLIPETKTPLMSSNVAGWFYLPKTSTIPTTSKGEQLMYLAQINCEELPEIASIRLRASCSFGYLEETTT